MIFFFHLMIFFKMAMEFLQVNMYCICLSAVAVVILRQTSLKTGTRKR